LDDSLPIPPPFSCKLVNYPPKVEDALFNWFKKKFSSNKNTKKQIKNLVGSKKSNSSSSPNVLKTNSEIKDDSIKNHLSNQSNGTKKTKKDKKKVMNGSVSPSSSSSSKKSSKTQSKSPKKNNNNNKQQPQSSQKKKKKKKRRRGRLDSEDMSFVNQVGIKKGNEDNENEILNKNDSKNGSLHFPFKQVLLSKLISTNSPAATLMEKNENEKQTKQVMLVVELDTNEEGNY